MPRVNKSHYASELFGKIYKYEYEHSRHVPLKKADKYEVFNYVTSVRPLTRACALIELLIVAQDKLDGDLSLACMKRSHFVTS